MSSLSYQPEIAKQWPRITSTQIFFFFPFLKASRKISCKFRSLVSEVFQVTLLVTQHPCLPLAYKKEKSLIILIQVYICYKHPRKGSECAPQNYLQGTNFTVILKGLSRHYLSPCPWNHCTLFLSNFIVITQCFPSFVLYNFTVVHTSASDTAEVNGSLMT